MRRRIVGNLRVGRPLASPADPSHVKGVRGGNETSAVDMSGFYSAGPQHRRGISDVRGTAARATGVNPGKRNPIDPRSPNLMPP